MNNTPSKQDILNLKLGHNKFLSDSVMLNRFNHQSVSLNQEKQWKLLIFLQRAGRQMRIYHEGKKISNKYRLINGSLSRKTEADISAKGRSPRAAFLLRSGPPKHAPTMQGNIEIKLGFLGWTAGLLAVLNISQV